MSASRYHNLTVKAVIDETHDARSLVFDVPAELAEAYRYRPGQFLTLRLPWQGRHLLRCYSMSSSPALGSNIETGQDSTLQVTIKRVEGGRGSNWICDQVKPGDRIDVMQPAGVFVPASFDGDFLLCGGGSGVTPVYSIMRSVLEKGQGRIRLIYANRDENSVIFRESLKSLAAQYPDRLEIIHLLDSVQGIPSRQLLKRLAEPMIDAQAFICGPGPFMDAMEAVLEQLGMPAGRVHVERFISLPDEEERDAAMAAALEQSAAESPEGAGVDSAQVTIELDGQVYEIDCAGNETVLKAAEKAGLELPYSCEVGMCASCQCEVKEGEVKLLVNDVLDERDLSRSLTLTCQAVPMTSKVKLRYT